MTTVVKPMLASDAETINFPVYASTKLDGIRALAINGMPTSRNGKPIRNKFVQAYFKKHAKALDGLDGELIVGPANAKNLFQVTTSGVMSEDGEPEFWYYVFDIWNQDSTPYDKRYHQMLKMKLPERVVVVDQKVIADSDSLLDYENKVLEQGFEGLIVRSINGHYKHGRSSAREGLLLKVKRFKDSEVEVIGFEELMSNQNVATKDVFGNKERSSHKENMVPMGMLGSLVCRHPNGQSFGIGTGFDMETRKEIWRNRKKYLGKLAKFKHFEVGAKDVYRFPVFLGWRDKNDL